MRSKRIAVWALTLLATVIVAGAGLSRLLMGDTSRAQVELGAYQDYSETELMDAVKCVERYFRWNFRDCTLERIYYLEEMSRYMSHVQGGDTGDAGDMVTLWIDFTPGRLSEAVWMPGSRQTGYHFLLTRDELGVWHTVPGQMGYA